MPIDPRGTTPGLAPKAKAKETTLNMKCKNTSCSSITATEIKIEGGQGLRVYRCIECGQTMPVNVGGVVSF